MELIMTRQEPLGSFGANSDRPPCLQPGDKKLCPLWVTTCSLRNDKYCRTLCENDQLYNGHKHVYSLVQDTGWVMATACQTCLFLSTTFATIKYLCTSTYAGGKSHILNAVFTPDSLILTSKWLNNCRVGAGLVGVYLYGLAELLINENSWLQTAHANNSLLLNIHLKRSGPWDADQMF